MWKKKGLELRALLLPGRVHGPPSDSPRKRLGSSLLITLIKGVNMSNKSSKSNSSKTLHHKDDQASLGTPGYRTREGRSGYDPIDTPAEAAHTAGSIIQKIFSGSVRNTFYLFLLGVLGLALILPLILAVSDLINGNQFPSNTWSVILISGIAGIAILVNAIKNLIKVAFR